MFTHTYKSIINIENIVKTWECFRSGKRYKKDVVEFEVRLAENISELFRSLLEKTYKHKAYSAFSVTDPKPRSIHKARVCDRILHHLLYQALYPYFDSRFIYDSYSCRQNKGVHRALDRLNVFARKVSKNHSRTCYVLKCDIKKFFASINQNVLNAILKRHIQDNDIRWLIEQVISSFYTTRHGVGLPLGNLTSQLFANVYMHEFDMYVKQELRVKYYIRYADDFVILSDDRSHLEERLSKLRLFLDQKLRLFVHENKISIKTYASGVDFLGWVHFPDYRVIRVATKRRMLRRIRENPTRETLFSYWGLLQHGNARKIEGNIYKTFLLKNPFSCKTLDFRVI